MKTMDYVEALANWCVRRGVALPVYKEVGDRTQVTFFGKDYSDTPKGRIGMHCAAQEAYEGSGVFGKVTQCGFVPLVRRDKEYLVDLAHGAPGCLLAAVRDAPVDVQVTAFAPYAYVIDHPVHTVDQPYNYTVYDTIHPGEEAYWTRVEWYIQMRLQTWLKDKTTVYICSSYLSGEHIRSLLEPAGISLVFM